MTRIIHDQGAQFCPDCGARLDNAERPLADSIFNDQTHEVNGKHLPAALWAILWTLRCRYPRIATNAVLNDLSLRDAQSRHNIPVHIFYLRKHLAGSKYGIVNIWGEGYRLMKKKHPRRTVLGQPDGKRMLVK